jgi:hypothetical protein
MEKYEWYEKGIKLKVLFILHEWYNQHGYEKE